MSKPEYDDDGFRCDAISAMNTSDKRKYLSSVWYYEENDGITVVFGGPGVPGGVRLAHIPAKRLLEWARVKNGERRR